MSESVRNALLKILEEPPSDCNFILLTSKRNAILPTILSRVRTYEFKNRSLNLEYINLCQSELRSIEFLEDINSGKISKEEMNEIMEDFKISNEKYLTEREQALYKSHSGNYRKNYL